MKTIAVLIACICYTLPASAQAARRASDTSLEGVVNRLYSVISGPAGPRDWDAFRGLFHKSAGMGAVIKYPGKEPVFKSFSPEDYIRMNDPFLKAHGFNERELHHQVFQYGNIAQVVSSYESEIADKGEKEQGINAIQLVREGGRWYVLSLIWQEASDELPLPQTFIRQ
jgi:hypothetical protein